MMFTMRLFESKHTHGNAPEWRKRNWALKLLLFALAVMFFEATAEEENKNVAQCNQEQDCNFWEFKCGEGKCINMRRFCDGNYDCPDKSDEVLPGNLGVSNNSDLPGVLCNNRMNEVEKTCMLPSAYLCDSIQNCIGNVDEYSATCGNQNRYKKRCNNDGVCINSKIVLCDECFNETVQIDDHYLYSGDDLQHHCASVIYRCSSKNENETGKCLNANQFCDGHQDCEDGSDEITDLDSLDGVLCKNKWNDEKRQCVLRREYVCDGIDHCENRSDECGPDCTKYSFICDNGKCISNSSRIFPNIHLGIQHLENFKDDCGDSSDATDQSEKFLCKDQNETVIALEKFCDGVKDCPNNMDERVYNGSKDQKVCKNRHVALERQCEIPEHHFCDGYELCEDFSDEYDEHNCPEYFQDYFLCDNKKLIHFLQECDFEDNCGDGSDECNCLSSTAFTCRSSGKEKCIAFSKFCDGCVDCDDGSDETTSPAQDGVMCNNFKNDKNKTCFLPQKYIKDGTEHCVNRVDECFAGSKHAFLCDDGTCIERESFCDGKPNCMDESDERIKGTGFKCDIFRESDHKTRTCILPQHMVTDLEEDCFDKSDLCSLNSSSTCFRCLTKDILIAKKQVCDDKIDCPDLSDECLCERDLRTKTMFTICRNVCFGIKGSTRPFACTKCEVGELYCSNDKKCISISKICDGRMDCSDNSDEAPCTKLNRKGESKNKNFRCDTTKNITDATECDGIPECSNFQDECSKKTVGNFSNIEDPNSIFQCGAKTLEICKHLRSSNKVDTFCPHSNEMVSTDKFCNGIEDVCQKNDTARHNFESWTWSDLSLDERYCKNQRMLCHKSRPTNNRLVSIPIEFKCNWIINCEMAEDEEEDLCQDDTSRFYCENSEPLMVHETDMFNGKEDCSDGSDECPSSRLKDSPFSSRYRLIKDLGLSALIWLMALLAICGNSVVIWHSFLKIKRLRRTLQYYCLAQQHNQDVTEPMSKSLANSTLLMSNPVKFSRMMKANCFLILNLALSDLLMGFYLLGIAIKNAATNGIYCKIDNQWRTSISCNILGTIAMISMQCSVFILLILTTYRMLAVLRPFTTDYVNARVTGVLISIAWCVSILLSCLPSIPYFENYFVSNVLLSSNIIFFQSNTPNLTTLQHFVDELNVMRINDSSLSISFQQTNDFTWTETLKILNDTYPKFWESFTVEGMFGYYSSNSVCLPRMFVTMNDTAWEYAAGIIIIDFIAFAYICLSYIAICYDTRKVGAAIRNQDENRTIQARITRVVVTDFACWVPVCILAFVSLSGVRIPPVVYAYAAVVLLPINSALNPIVYTNILDIGYNGLIKPASTFLQQLFTSRQKKTQRINKPDSDARALCPDNEFAQQPESALMLPGTPPSTTITKNSPSMTTMTSRL